MMELVSHMKNCGQIKTIQMKRSNGWETIRHKRCGWKIYSRPNRLQSTTHVEHSRAIVHTPKQSQDKTPRLSDHPKLQETKNTELTTSLMSNTPQEVEQMPTTKNHELRIEAPSMLAERNVLSDTEHTIQPD